MKIRIRSDGNPHHTEIADEQGNLLEGVTKVKWRQDGPAKLPIVTLDLYGVEVDIEGQMEETNPGGDR
jgi:hypothetical protein